ncbi:component of atp-dependent dsDNA exonuclease [Anaeramoeba flamelloides]|uniref:Component of atp-dependent dsDNA exonuclease n=1 Tax=Anaeramoeba flamelloides TaxID=1746091 RepID=A0ABQ8YV33_9EUKA|nr:component of atp-dependent dsDNA exonuclease [Anaeramoeba flamelloides]
MNNKKFSKQEKSQRLPTTKLKKRKRYEEKKKKHKRELIVCFQENTGLPMIRLRSNKSKLVKIEPFSGRWNAIVITDCHFNNGNNSFYPTKLIPKTINKLGKLIRSEEVDQLITLGDLFQNKCKSSEYMLQIVEEMANFGAEMFMIGGNHDRGKTYQLSQKLPKQLKSRVHIISTEYFMGCFPSQPNEDEVDLEIGKSLFQRAYPRIVFTHDAGNYCRLSDPEIELFLRGIKYQHPFFKPSDLLVMGHTHRNRWFGSENMGSLSPFHIGLKSKIRYGRLTETKSGGALKWNVKGVEK